MTSASPASHLLRAAERVFFADTRSRPLDALAQACEALRAIDPHALASDADRRALRYILDIADAYPPDLHDFSSDVRNEVREALALLFELHARYGAGE